ncbi:MAG: 50S ribosomal protein L24 [Lachnospirales bacterium]
MASKIKKGDMVRVVAGKDGILKKEGKVLAVDNKKHRVIVEGINMISKHQKPSAAHQAGGIINKEAPIDISNVMYLHKGQPTRIGFKVEVTEENGKRKVVKKRFAKKTGDIID